MNMSSTDRGLVSLALAGMFCVKSLQANSTNPDMNISDFDHPVIQPVPGVHAGADTGGLDVNPVILYSVLAMLVCMVAVLCVVYLINKDRSRSSKKSEACAEALCECGEGGGAGGDGGTSRRLNEAVKGSEGL